MTRDVPGDAATLDWHVALVGNPNCGKTALFNLLTGARQKVANYAGVTVERKAGTARLHDGRSITVIDLPGAYSLHPASPDEQVTLEVIEGRREGEAAPDLIVAVVDATNLRMNLRLVLELQRLGRPMLVALNMADVARTQGLAIDVPRLAAELGLLAVVGGDDAMAGLAEERAQRTHHRRLIVHHEDLQGFARAPTIKLVARDLHPAYPRIGTAERNDSNRSSQASRRASSANSTRMVLSPARVPSCLVKVDSSMACPMALATPASDTSSTIKPERPTWMG